MYHFLFWSEPREPNYKCERTLSVVSVFLSLVLCVHLFIIGNNYVLITLLHYYIGTVDTCIHIFSIYVCIFSYTSIVVRFTMKDFNELVKKTHESV